MKLAVRLAMVVLCVAFVVVTGASAQVPVKEGNVERVVLIHINAGHGDAFWADMKKNTVPMGGSESRRFDHGLPVVCEPDDLKSRRLECWLLADLQEHGRAGRTCRQGIRHSHETLRRPDGGTESSG